MSIEAIEAALLQENERKCDPPLDPDEVHKIAIGKASITPDANSTARNELQSEVTQLVKLTPLQYDQCRKQEAKRLGVRPGTLDAEVNKARQPTDSRQGSAVVFEDPEPWYKAVDGAALLSELVGVLRKYVVLPEHAETAIALWIIFTHAIESFSTAPILFLTSPEKRCGKTTLLSIIAKLVRRPLATANISPAALFRAVEAWTPTLLIDEADTFLDKSDELRGIINSGHTRGSAFVVRTVGDDFEVRRFSTWGARVLAMIGKPDPTILDRSVCIPLRRKLKAEVVDKLRSRGADPELFVRLARQCARFAMDNSEHLKQLIPQVPDILDDRAADCWEPLTAIAETAGGDWPKRTRDAATALSGAGVGADTDSMKELLLSDIQHIFAERNCGKMFSRDLCKALIEMEERPWPEFQRGKPISQSNLAKILNGFGIASATIRIDVDTAKGYRLAQFDDAFLRYLGESSVTPSQVSTGAGSPKLRLRNRPDRVTDNKSAER